MTESSDEVSARYGEGSRVSAQITAEVMEQIALLSYGQGFSDGLRPAQWAALRYFARAEPQARTVGRFAQHNMVTPGSASQTIQTLVKRGLLVRVPAEHDRRSHRVDLTEQGISALTDDPIGRLVDAIRQLEQSDGLKLADLLATILQSMYRNQAPS
jgi:DNA-binding MarR family transcriptional regulator